MENNFSTSGIKGLSPDAYTMSKLKSGGDINANLKNTIKTIM
jgi:hypothetical protein